MPVRINKDTGGKRFSLVCGENRDLNHMGSTWTITEVHDDAIPNDEIASFKLSGDAGIRVEFYNSSSFDKQKSWAEVQLTSQNQHVEIADMRHSAGAYVHHHQSGDDHIDGKVSAIKIFVLT